MRVAATIHDGRIAPVFESARRLLVACIPEGPEPRLEVDLSRATVLERVSRVRETGADELVCGGITATVRDLLEARGVRVRPWVALDVETALKLIAERTPEPGKIAVSAVERGPDARIDPRFGRAPWLVIHDTESGLYESVANPHATARRGAGIQAARLVLGLRVGSIITGRCGPNVFGTLCVGDVTVFTGVEGTVRQAIGAHRQDRLSAARGPSDLEPWPRGESGSRWRGRGRTPARRSRVP